MTRIVAPSGDVVEKTKRGRMTKARKSKSHALAGGLCAWCQMPVAVWGSEVVYDHRIPLALGGADDEGNIRPLHRIPCDRLKTAFDKKLIAKAERLRRRANGTRRARKKIPKRAWSKAKRPIPSRPFP